MFLRSPKKARFYVPPQVSYLVSMEMLNRKSLVLRGLCRGRLYLLPGPDFRVEEEKKREKKMKNKPSMNKQLSIVSVPDADIEWRCSEQMFHMIECWAYTAHEYQ